MSTKLKSFGKSVCGKFLAWTMEGDNETEERFVKIEAITAILITGKLGAKPVKWNRKRKEMVEGRAQMVYTVTVGIHGTSEYEIEGLTRNDALSFVANARGVQDCR